jgi:hypothetical protein
MITHSQPAVEICQPPVAQLAVYTGKNPCMQNTTTLIERIIDTIAGDKPPTVSRKLQTIGISVSYQAIHKWLKGGGVSDEALEALAHVYKVNIAWLKYGQGDKRDPVAEVMDALPLEDQQQVLDFIQFRLNRPGGPLSPQSINRYMSMIEKIKDDMRTKKGGKK